MTFPFICFVSFTNYITCHRRPFDVRIIHDVDVPILESTYMAKRDLESEGKNFKSGGFFVFCMILYVGCIILYFVFDTYSIKDHINGDKPIKAIRRLAKKNNISTSALWIQSN